MENNLFAGLSTEQLNEVKAKYPFYASQVEAELAKRESQAAEIMAKLEAEAQAKIEEEKINQSLLKTFIKTFPNKPDNLNNVLFVWREVEVLDGEPIEVEVNGTIETRQASHKELQPQVIRNVFWSIDKQSPSKAGTKDTKRKLAETVKKLNGDTVEVIGNFRSGHEACQYLGLDDAGNSGNRVLRDNGYILEPYDGTEYTVK